MTDPITWLREQLDTDEREINRHPIDGMDQLYQDEEDGYLATGESNYPCESMLTVGKRFALAEVDAKRRILDAITRIDISHVAARDLTALLALPYAQREGYRQEWRP